MQYEVVFDVIEAGYRQWWFPAVGLLFVVIGVGLLAYRRANPVEGRSASDRLFPYFFTGFAVVWVTLAFVGTFWEYWRLREALRTGQCEVIEGPVTDFVLMPAGGKKKESFVVNGRRFEYSDNIITVGFNNTRSHGGPIRDGLRVRIAHVDGKIARLEIAR